MGVHQYSPAQTLVIWIFWTVFFSGPGKKNTANLEKEWLVREWLSIFSREKIKYDTFGSPTSLSLHSIYTQQTLNAQPKIMERNPYILTTFAIKMHLTKHQAFKFWKICNQIAI